MNTTHSEKKRPKLRKKRVLLVAAGGVAVLAGGILLYKTINPLSLKSSSPIVELGDSYDPKDNIRSVFFGSPDSVGIFGVVDSHMPGTYEVVYSFRGKEYTTTVTVQDTKAPELKVKNVEAEMNEELDAESFVDSVKDSSKVSLSIVNPDVLKIKEGVSTVEIKATDAFGNSTTKKARLTRLKDTIPPEVDPSNPARVTVSLNGEWKQTDLIVHDNQDPNPTITVDSSALDLSTPGSYTVIYTITDASGNKTTFNQTVDVIDGTLGSEMEATSKVVYLTFDDGPSENTKAILDILNRYGIKATFFVTGNNQACNNYIKEAYDAGNTIGLHTYSHDYASLYASDEAYFNDLQQVSDMVENLTGTKSYIIRFPGGSSNMVSASYNTGIMTRLSQEVLDRGYQYFDWNVSSTDASANTAPKENILAGATSGDGYSPLVILFHDSAPKTTTVEALPQIIEHYLSDGYVFAPLDINSYPAHHGLNN